MYPKVAVFIPTKNAGSYLAEALASLQNQTYKDLSIHVFDGGSSDATVGIAQSIAQGDPRVHCTVADGTSVNARANAFLRTVQPDIFINAHADDINFNERVARQVAHFVDNPKSVLVGSAAKFWLHDPQNCDLKYYSGLNEYPESHEDIVVRLPFWWSFSTPSVALNAAAMRQAGLLLNENLSVAGDWDLYWQLSKLGRLTNLALPLVAVRHHHSSDGARNSEAIANESRQLRARIAGELGIARALSAGELNNFLDLVVEYDWVSAGSRSESSVKILRKLSGVSTIELSREAADRFKIYVSGLASQIDSSSARPNKLVNHWENLISERDDRIAALTRLIRERDNSIVNINAVGVDYIKNKYRNIALGYNLLKRGANASILWLRNRSRFRSRT